MKHTISRIALWVAMLVGVIIGYVGVLSERKWIMAIGIIIILAGFVQTMFFHRCPHCNEPLNIRGAKPKYCPECGGKIEW